MSEESIGTKRVVRAEVLGFCPGVRRAVALVEDSVASAAGADRRVCTLGEVVHNRDVVESFGRRGVAVVDERGVRRGDVVVLRAHGVTPEVAQRIRGRGAEVVDATCAKVRRSQDLVTLYRRDGFFVVIAGQADHPEVVALAAHAGAHAVVDSVSMAERLEIPPPAVLIAQTTFGGQEFRRIAESLKTRIRGLVVENTLCPATEARERAAVNLAARAQAIVVVGGKNSANTRGLFETVKATGLPCVHVENAGQIPEDFRAYHTMGVTAGASTPDWIIDEVERSFLEGGRNGT